MSQNQKPSLLVDFCSYQAAKWAVEHWHYSRTMPVGKMVRFGVWENGEFIGVVIYSRGASPSLASSYGLYQTELVELVRIALTTHKTFVSHIVKLSINKLKEIHNKLRLVISFADPYHCHNGAIYQALNWIFHEQTKPEKTYYHDGKWKHSREVRGGPFGKCRKIIDYSGLPTRILPGKYKYLYPLDKAMRRQIEPLAKPYPKRAGVGEMESR